MPSYTKKAKKVVKKIKKSNGLTQKQKDKLKEHAKHHTTKHMSIMTKMIKGGTSFSKAHSVAQKMVGK